MRTLLIVACAVCFGSSDPRMTYILLGMLATPFVVVGSMFGFLYYRGVFRTTPAPDDSTSPHSPASKH